MVCRGKTSAGTNCKANAMSGSNYCFTHNPATRQQHIAATRKGGAISPTKLETTLLPKAELTSLQSVIEILADTINRVRVVRPDWDEGKEWGWFDALKAAEEVLSEEERAQHQKEIYDDARVR
jgi:hypothetical protein